MSTLDIVTNKVAADFNDQLSGGDAAAKLTFDPAWISTIGSIITQVVTLFNSCKGVNAADAAKISANPTLLQKLVLLSAFWTAFDGLYSKSWPAK